MPDMRAISTYPLSRRLSTWARMVRVGLSQASEATTSAIWLTDSPPRIDTAMMISTSRPGTVRPMSAMPRMIVSASAPVVRGGEGQHRADADAEESRR